MSAIDPAIDELQTLRDFIRLGVCRFRRAGLFYGHGTDNAWDETVQLALHAAGLPWGYRSSSARCAIVAVGKTAATGAV